MGKDYTVISTIIANTIINKGEDNTKSIFLKNFIFLKSTKEKIKEETYAIILKKILSDEQIELKEYDDLMCAIKNNEKKNLIRRAKEILQLDDETTKKNENICLFKLYINSLFNNLTKRNKEILDNLLNNISIDQKTAIDIYKGKAFALIQRELNEIIADGIITPEEDNRLNELQGILGVKLDLDDKSLSKLEGLRENYQTLSKGLKTIKTDINLIKGEECYYICNAVYRVIKMKAHKITYAGWRYRWKLFGGITFTAGQTNFDIEHVKDFDYKGTGELYITNKRIIFTGETDNFNIKYEKILKYEIESSTLIIQKDNGNPIALTLGGNILEFRKIFRFIFKGDFNDERYSIKSLENNLEDADFENHITSAIEYIRKNRRISATAIQKNLNINFEEACNIIDELEKRGYIGPLEGAKPREIYI